jgi:hypothetical protein
VTRRPLRVALGAIVALAIGVACGEVPTLPLGIAYITPIITPSPSVAFGDTLRDSLGDAAPLRVYAIGRSDGDTIRNIALRFLITSLGSRATIDGSGYLVAPDSLQTLRLVAQVTDPAGGSGLQLQTPEFTIDVVPRADTIVATGTIDTAQALPLVRALSVTVSGVGPRQVRGTVGGIIVRFSIDSIYPSSVGAPGRYYLATEGSGLTLRPDSTMAVDTTTTSGVASRSFIGVLGPSGQGNADSVLVRAHARTQSGALLRPGRIMIRMKKT